jgi:hypothetical protein
MSTILHSIYGRKLGLDANGYVTVGESKGIALPAIKVGASGSEIAMFGSTAVVAHTSATTGTDIVAAGVTTISSAVTTWRLDPPAIGVVKWIARLSSDTATTGTINLESGAILSSANSTGTVISMTGNSVIGLVGLTTALWGFITRYPSTSQVVIT